jgi:hypothetical protein
MDGRPVPAYSASAPASAAESPPGTAATFFGMWLICASWVAALVGSIGVVTWWGSAKNNISDLEWQVGWRGGYYDGDGYDIYQADDAMKQIATLTGILCIIALFIGFSNFLMIMLLACSCCRRCCCNLFANYGQGGSTGVLLWVGLTSFVAAYVIICLFVSVCSILSVFCFLFLAWAYMLFCFYPRALEVIAVIGFNVQSKKFWEDSQNYTYSNGWDWNLQIAAAIMFTFGGVLMLYARSANIKGFIKAQRHQQYLEEQMQSQRS